MNRRGCNEHVSIGSRVMNPKPLAACLALALASFNGMAAGPTAGNEVLTPRERSYPRAVGTDYAYRSARTQAHVHSHLPTQTLPVTSCADDNGAGTLRSVVAGAASGDLVDLSALTCSTITLTQGAIQSTVEDLDIQGPGQDALTLDGNYADRVIVHSGSGTLGIADLSFRNGYLVGDLNGGCVRSYGNIELTRSRVSNCVVAADSYAAGGGIAARANLTLIDSTVSGNTITTSNNYYGYLYGGGANAVGDLVVTRSTISGNRLLFTGTDSPYSLGYGGGINARANASIIASTIDSNESASFGGGIFISGHDHEFTQLEIVNSTISGNSAEAAGGGVSVGGQFRTYLASFVMRSSTIAHNLSSGAGGGLHFRDYTLVDVQSSIVATNIAPAEADLNADESLTVYGAGNLIGDADVDVALPSDTLRTDPQLLDLADNGGPTRTHALDAGSPAIDAGNNYFDLESDQRGEGFTRVSGSRADIGAYELVQQIPNDLIFVDGFDPAPQ